MDTKKEHEIHIQISQREGQTKRNIHLSYQIPADLASQEDIDNLSISEEVALVLYESARELINAQNKEVKHQVLHFEEGFSELAMSLDRESVFREVAQHMEWSKLDQLLDGLTDKQRRRFYLYHGLGYTYQEIAEMEGVSWQRVQQSVRQAKKKIMNKL